MNKSLVYSLLAPATAWFIQLNLSYMFSVYDCRAPFFFHVLSWLLIVITASGVLAAWKCWRFYSASGPKNGRSREFLSLGSLVLGATLLLVVIAGELSNLMLEVCQ